MKIAFLALCKALGLFALSRALTRRGLRILCYHGIWVGEGHFGDYLFMSPAKFRRRMQWLARAGYPVIGLDDAVKGLANDALPPHATVITIDDGWYGTYLHMVPLLRDLGLPSTLYVSTYYVEKQLPVFDVALQYVVAHAPERQVDLNALGITHAAPIDLDSPAGKQQVMNLILEHATPLNGQESCDLLLRLTHHLGMDITPLLRGRVFHLMTADEVRAALAGGMDIQLHTHRHRLTLENVADLDKELSDNARSLATMTDRPLSHFCYPSGVWSEATWPILAAHAVSSATTTVQGFNYAGAQVLGLKRLLDGESVHDLEFEAEMSGFFDLKRRLLGR